jgi:hypothetical protein
MIHYPQDKADAMIQHLASLAEERLVISFAPKTLGYSILKRIGELFPGPSKVRGLGYFIETGLGRDDGTGGRTSASLADLCVTKSSIGTYAFNPGQLFL